MKEFNVVRGPWVWSHNSASTDDIYCIEISELNSAFSIASLQSYEGIESLNKESTLQYANIIAAAPELLDALQDVLGSYQNFIHHEFSSFESEDASVIKAKKAIAKALSESK